MTVSASQSGPDRPLLVLLWRADDRNVDWAGLRWLGDADFAFALDSGIEDQFPQGLEIEPIQGSTANIGKALRQLNARYPQADVLLFRSDLIAPERFVQRLQELMQQDDRPDQILMPGNYSGVHAEQSDPLLGLPYTEQLDPDSLLQSCGDRCWQWVDTAPLDCLLIRFEMIAERSANIGRAPAALVDDFYICDPAVSNERVLPEEARPPLGRVRLRVSELLRAGISHLPTIDPNRQPVTLHIAHSWGGGVWRWIEDFIDGDDSSRHLVLVAESDGPGQRCGRRLQLCALGPGRGVIREFELSPDIDSTARTHVAYAEHLQAVINRFGVGRIIVSSLIGHSLDCLKTGLPTLQVLHDFYPLWPFLDYDPEPFTEAGQGVDFERAFDQYGPGMRLRPQRPEFWRRLTHAWRDAVDRHAVELIAPTRHVIERWRLMNPEMHLDIGHEPHGFRPFTDERLGDATPDGEIETSPANRDAKLHLLIPGRLTAGKGLNLLKQALPGLRKYARLTALGCGREAFSLMGESGIDLIPNYQRDELPGLIQTLRPHAALLLSTVPETWNYTLSEIRALNVLPVATNIGSFRERIEHGVDGFLIEPEPDALIAQVRMLYEQHEQIVSMLARSRPERSPADQANAIRARIPGRLGTLPMYQAMQTSQSDSARLAAELADARQAAIKVEREQLEMRGQLSERTRWAHTMERQFRQRSEWAERLNRDNQALQSDLSDSQQALADQTELQRRTAQDLEQTSVERERIQQLVDQIIASRSWRITRPLRVLNRVLTGPVVPKLLNPLNWPRLIGTFIHHWRLRGLKQTLWLLQSLPPPEPEPATVGETSIPQADRVASPLSLPVVDQPRISIVVPVHNQLHYTAACLHSVFAATNTTTYELIVVDDASSDGTRRWLKRCRGLKVLTNRNNLGFIGSCNRGASAARGEFVLFLNNDTKVTDRWLDTMLAVFEQQAGVGVVGARLVFADGSLQEAGGIIFDDGSGWNYGRGDDADRPQYSFLSETDYVSGACLMLRRALFEQLEGFDTHYSPAYYEDTDLCFRVREKGLKVMYQPAATVVHFEGVTSGTDESSGTKRYQAVNREKFIERWQQQLERQPPQDIREQSADPVRHLRYHRHAKRALVIDAVTPMPQQDSGSVRMFALLKLLDQIGYQTSFMPSNLAWAGADSIGLQQAGIEVLTAPWLNDAEDWLAEHGSDLDLVLVSRHYVLSPLLRLIRYYCPNARLLFDTVDLHFLREEREAELAGSAAVRREAARTRRAELELVDKADATLVVSEFEAGLLADLKPDARVQVVSNVHSLQDPGKSWIERKDLLFVGGFQHPPNQDAAVWLIDKILPLIRAELDDVKLHLIGSKMPDEIRERQAPGLVVHGFVADLEPYLNGCRVSLAPLRYGAGVKGKVNQAMSHGLPVVATSCAAEGMYTTHEQDVLMADTAEAFAAEVVRVYRDQALWQTIAANGRENVERHFSVAAAERALLELLSDLEA